MVNRAATSRWRTVQRRVVELGCRKGADVATPQPAARTIVVLGGGGALGAYQAGALLALAEADVLPDVLFGCSVGSLNAAVLAADPSVKQAARLADLWSDTRTHGVLAPSMWGRVRGLASAAASGARALFDERPLRRLVADNVPAHDIAELAVPLTVTTTCLDCGAAKHHSRGRIGDLLVASCALPGLFPPVRLADGHRHVDGGVVCGVPVEPAVAMAGSADRVLVLDCALAPVTGRAGACAALPDAEQVACGLSHDGSRIYAAPVEMHRGALQVMLDAFAVARAVANRAGIAQALCDPRVEVLPHVADAWAAGLLENLPSGPRDTSAAGALLAAGWTATRTWLGGRELASAAAADERGGERSAHLA
jgi:predicted acylesterase/phospholipase RssA